MKMIIRVNANIESSWRSDLYTDIKSKISFDFLHHSIITHYTGWSGNWSRRFKRSEWF